MRILVDTNVVLDVIARREPFYPAAAQVWSMAERGQVEAFISAISLNNVFYIVRKAEGADKARQALRLLRDVFQVVAADLQIMNQAIDADIRDFEDAIQFHSAVRANVAHLVTRNPDDFPTGTLAVLTPEEFLASRLY